MIEYILYNPNKELIHQGSCSDVFRIKNAMTGDTFIVKIFHYTPILNGDPNGDYEREIKALSNLKHPNIIRLLGHYQSRLPFKKFIVVEEALIDLFDLMNKTGLTIYMIRYILLNVLTALEFIHSKGFYHGDLKHENIVISKEYDIKLIDFAYSHTTDKQTNRFFGTPLFAAPEMLGYSFVSFNKEVDIWACGIILYTFFDYELPFDKEELGINGLKEFHQQKILEPPETMIKHTDFCELFSAMTKKDINQRATANELLRYKAFYKKPNVELCKLFLKTKI